MADGRRNVSEGSAAAGASILREGAIGLAAGLAGTLAMTAVLLAGTAIGAFELASVAGLAAILGLGDDRVVGYLLVFAAGVVLWPLLFVAIGERVPGGADPSRGLAFGTVMWSGFVLAFRTDQTGRALALYASLTLLAHWAYGFVLGAAFEYLAERVPKFTIENTPLL
jgi:hypothetical protein